MKVAIIPARGGSKRIPRKNIKLFHGKPMIAYSIEAALHSGCFDKVIVSTDDSEIAEVAKQYGAEVPFMRPANISDDYATTMDVIHHAIVWCEEQNMAIDSVCCLYATAPFVLSDDLLQGQQTLLSNSSVEFVFSAATFSFPIQRALKLSETGSVNMFSPENELIRSQDLEEAYHDAGQFYWGRREAFLEKKAIFAPHSRVVLLPRNRVQDIDTQEDWDFAEALYLLLNR
ncbi:N-acylneuraminate cytidylyltransferase [Vibrio scophthalmi]|uniref:pseudaminic acid cytidylyltransferase n=1 Tax=Vibrio scophthalmi TaxID=45658 RepID=UPI0008095147|nr:pseudaminic acid cytidylyltransferase [Vibrio scophthalmi]ANS84164.1 N-acylneuraminate cytidylyltransferase [Vibrio scophthalmi]